MQEYDYNEAIPIKYVLYGQFVKYEKMDELFTQYFQTHPLTNNWINIYIDLYQMLLPIYKFQKIDNPYDITSTICNMAIHYKDYFRQRGINSFVFLLYSPTTGAYSNLRFCPEYNSTYTARMMNNRMVYDLVNQNLSLIGIITPYLPNIYFKMGTVETSVMAYDMITKFNNRNMKLNSLFITSSQYAFQLAGNMNANCTLLYKKKDKDKNDISYLVSTEDALDKYIAEIKNQHIEHHPVRQSWLSGFMTLSGIPKRNIKSMYNYKQALNILNKIDQQFDQTTPDSLFSIATDLYPKSNLGQETYDNIINRYKCIDMDYQLFMYHNTPDAIETGFLKQKDDMETLMQLNDKYFKLNPISIDKL